MKAYCNQPKRKGECISVATDETPSAGETFEILNKQRQVINIAQIQRVMGARRLIAQARQKFTVEAVIIA